MKMKHVRIMIAALLTAIAAYLGGCGAAAGNGSTAAKGQDGEPNVTLIYAEVNPEDSIAGHVAQAFKEEAERASDGSLNIAVYYNGKLGFEDEVMKSMMDKDESIQIARISAFALNNYGAEDTAILTLPYLFDNRDHFWAFAESELADRMLEEDGAKMPVHGLCYGEEGFRHFITREKIYGYRNFEGMKIRVYDDPIMMEMVRCLGAEPVSISFGELYNALRAGEVDGAEQPIVNYRVNALPEVAQEVYLDGHTLGILEIVIADSAWDDLTDKQKSAIRHAARYAQKENRRVVEEMEAGVVEELQRDKIDLVTSTREDIAGMKSLWAPVIEANTAGKSQHLADLYQQIREFEY